MAFISNLFVLAPVLGNLLVNFTGSNIVVAVFNIAMLIREFFKSGKDFKSIDELAVNIINEVPDPIKHRYGLLHIKLAVIKIAEAMEHLHMGKEVIKQNGEILSDGI